MRFSYLLYLAYRNLFSHKMRTILTAGGVAISVGFIVFLISFGLGLQRISTDQITNLEALQVLDVSVAKSKVLSINDETMNKFSKLGNVEKAYPQVSSATKVSFNKSSIDGVVYGKNVEYLDLEDIKLSSGKKYTNDSVDEAIINIASQTQLDNGDMLGKEITLDVVIRSELLQKDEKVKQFSKTFKIVGIVNDKSAPFVYVPLHIFTDNGVVNYSNAKIKMVNKNDVTQAKLQIENMGLKANSIKETIDQINQFFNIFQVILISFGGIAILVACLGMFNTLTISLIEKTREVGFMKALGTMRHDVYWLFTLESVLIGAIGSVVGVFAGVGTGTILNTAIFGLASSTGNQAVELFYIPIYLVLLILCASLLVSLMTGIYPARRAAKISPLDAMRYE
ncbi:MAG: FtsX-like permease family protein [Candidatus Saccharibacteria bacterium]